MSVAAWRRLTFAQTVKFPKRHEKLERSTKLNCWYLSIILAQQVRDECSVFESRQQTITYFLFYLLLLLLLVIGIAICEHNVPFFCFHLISSPSANLIWLWNGFKIISICKISIGIHSAIFSISESGATLLLEWWWMQKITI